VDVARFGHTAGEQRRIRRAPEPPREVEQVGPHELRREHAVGRRALGERRRDWIAGFGRARVGRCEQREQLGVRDAFEVLSRLAWEPGVRQPLEELLRPAGDTGAVEQRAQQHAPAARRGTHEN
jgi:hypothetical protein